MKEIFKYTLCTLLIAQFSTFANEKKRSFEDDVFQRMEKMMEQQDKIMRKMMDDFAAGDDLFNQFGPGNRFDFNSDTSLTDSELIHFEKKEVEKGKIEYRIAPKVEGVELQVQCQDNGRISIQGSQKIKKEETENGEVVSSYSTTRAFSNSFFAEGEMGSRRDEGKTTICTYDQSASPQRTVQPNQLKLKKKKEVEEEYEEFRPEKGDATI